LQAGKRKTEGKEMRRIQCGIITICVLCTCSALLTIASNPDIPVASIEHISLNPSNFYVSVRVNTVPERYGYCLLAYEGPPQGYSGDVQRIRVSDCVGGGDGSVVLLDTSTPLSPSGRTYTAGIAIDVNECTNGCEILGVNEVYAPYPYFTNPVISEISISSTSVYGHQLIYGEGLYTNRLAIRATNPVAFFRISGTNHIPTNIVFEQSLDGLNWFPATMN
jgi:hypothetical protein